MLGAVVALTIMSHSDDTVACSPLQGYPGPQAAMLGGVVLLMYLAGWLYSRHLPERWRPGAYDLVGNSHQWMHALVSVSSVPCLRRQICSGRVRRCIHAAGATGC
jgi:predicted membrane channel-forming protein YqfA (hemolysin III family)